MSQFDELFSLMDLDKALKPDKYNRLNLRSLAALQNEVKTRIDKVIVDDMKKRGKSEEEIRAYIKESFK